MRKEKEAPIATQAAAKYQDQPAEARAYDLAAAVRFHRKKSALSQQELAKLAGLGKTVIFDIEKGKKTIQLDTLLKVLQILNIEMRFSSPLMERFLEEQNAPSRSIRSR